MRTSQKISILAVLADRDRSSGNACGAGRKFQSSRSLRTATLLQANSIGVFEFQSSRSLRTATPRLGHSLGKVLFQSSRSLRTATLPGWPYQPGHRISILAVLADRDPGKACPVRRQRHFNPRGPCGPRPDRLTGGALPHALFQSSRSLRTATSPIRPEGMVRVFQSSRSLRTATNGIRSKRALTRHFNPRGPCGPRRKYKVICYMDSQFQSSRSLRTATRNAEDGGNGGTISILAVLADRDVPCRIL